MNVLYIVCKSRATSIPLEVAAVMVEKKIDLTVAAFKEKDVNKGHFVPELVPLKARSIFDPRGIINLYQCILETEPDVVHLHHTASALWGGILAKLVAGTAVIRTEHNNQQHYTLPQNILHGFSQLLSDRVLCNSKDTYRNLYPLQKWAIGDSWEVVYNGIDASRIEAAASRNPPVCLKELEDQVLIGTVGRLVDQKNYQRLIEAFPLVLEEVPEAHLVLIGDGENRSQLEREAVAQGIDGRVTFMGECPRDDVYAALHAFDLFVMPSLWEGFCNAVVEAMAAGLPVVSSDIATLREVIGGMAVYVDPKDPGDIGSGIAKELKKRTRELEKMGKECKNHAKKKYSLEKTSERYISNYQKVTKSC